MARYISRYGPHIRTHTPCDALRIWGCAAMGDRNDARSTTLITCLFAITTVNIIKPYPVAPSWAPFPVECGCPWNGRDPILFATWYTLLTNVWRNTELFLMIPWWLESPHAQRSNYPCTSKTTRYTGGNGRGFGDSVTGIDLPHYIIHDF